MAASGRPQRGAAAFGRLALWDLDFIQKILLGIFLEYSLASWLSLEVFFEYAFEHPSEYSK